MTEPKPCACAFCRCPPLKTDPRDVVAEITDGTTGETYHMMVRGPHGRELVIGADLLREPVEIEMRRDYGHGIVRLKMGLDLGAAEGSHTVESLVDVTNPERPVFLSSHVLPRGATPEVEEDHGHCHALSDPCSPICAEQMHECNPNHIDPCDICREMAREREEQEPMVMRISKLTTDYEILPDGTMRVYDTVTLDTIGEITATTDFPPKKEP